ncbi:tetratricopeptide repeat protein [Oleiharenicola lentus]|jgi:tetratricopeptide (TPR) repeat protein|uniref:Tetratricopeptide repeat protein n=1 Tax=Oleiharenicola lentus TaxID=2508720 RepID=A0A4Q1C6N2_9BACT|nr:tetratricopeptide repeat protein [Oleiharenicola lentus]RXK54547.1 tetratricopeptide repeat protein [Oleiharenicola lentus]
MPSPVPARFTVAALGPAVLVVAAVIAVYAGTLRAPLLFDDRGAITENTSIRSLATAWFPPADGSTTTARPVLNFSFALTYKLSGAEPWGHRAGNIAFHAAAALALLGVARRLFQRVVPEAAPSLALGLALLWALHPLQTESVTCVAQRTEVLCGFFLLGTLYAFLRGTDCSGGLRPPGVGDSAVIDRRYSQTHRPWLVVSVVTCLLGMGSKEVMVSAPLLVLLADRTFVAGSFVGAWRARRSYYLALAATWLLLVILVLGAGGTRGSAAGLGLGVSGWTYLLKQAEALVLYLKLSFWPHPLVLDYGTAVAASPAEVWWQGLVVWTLVGGTLWALWRRPALGFAGVVFFAILAPSSSVVPLVTQTMAEHRMYLPLAAVLALALIGLHRLTGPRAWPGWGALALVFAGLTVARNHDYRDALVIWSDSVAKYPTSARAQHNLAVELLNRGRAGEALTHAENARTLSPDYLPAHYTGGLALLELGRAPEAVIRLEQAVKLGPAHADAHLALGNALMRAGRAADAVAAFRTSLELKPAADAQHNLAVVLLELGRPAEAEQAWRSALTLDPGLVPARRRLGLLLAQAGRLPEAGEQFRVLVEWQPDDPDARANYGNVLLLTRRPAEAAAQYEAALRLRPGDTRVQENLRLAREALAGR